MPSVQPIHSHTLNITLHMYMFMLVKVFMSTVYVCVRLYLGGERERERGLDVPLHSLCMNSLGPTPCLTRHSGIATTPVCVCVTFTFVVFLLFNEAYLLLILFNPAVFE